MKRLLIAILILMVGIATANAQNLLTFTQYRFTMDEYGEMYPKTDKAAECYARIEISDSLQCIKIFTKAYGNASINYDTSDIIEGENYIHINYYKNNIRVAVVVLNYDYKFQSLIYIKQSYSIIYGK